jgi:putative DNA primase/helicase
MDKLPLDLRTAERMLDFVHDQQDRHTWVSVGMALKSEFGDAAFDAWLQWSSQAENFDAKSCKTSWRGFKAGGIGIGTLIKLAMDGGFKFDKTQSAPDRAEMARRKAARVAALQAEAATQAQRHQDASAAAMDVWLKAHKTGNSAYVQRKGIDAPESVRFMDDGTLLVPMLRYDLPRAEALKGLQTIAPDGTKRFTPGMAKSGTACRLGLAVVGEPVFVCEGYATGMTLRMALGRRHAVFVAFDAFNLPHVVQAVHEALPTSPIVICADDDHATKFKGVPYNTGRIQAQIAHDAVMDAHPGARLVVRTYPSFARTTERSNKDTDFNDLHRLEGLDAVTKQLDVCTEAIVELKKYG